jgi:hypothetical protein
VAYRSRKAVNPARTTGKTGGRARGAAGVIGDTW